MGVRVHDLLRLRNPEDLVAEGPIPGWVLVSLERAPWVVVRRPVYDKSLVAVGVRGCSRNQRFAALLPFGRIVHCVSPEQLTSPAGWMRSAGPEKIQAFQVLEELSSLYSCYGLEWGPTGSVGFELASRLPAVNLSSDLDLIIRSECPFDRELARILHQVHEQVAIRVDVLLETPYGAVALAEYAQREAGASVLLRTCAGPKLVQNPWSSCVDVS
jgi:phosphoribosyl-dephospho-CoA transferase